MRVILLPTLRCNMACEYCYERILNLQFQEHNYREWLRVFNQFPSSTVDISGGEPTFQADFTAEVLRFAVKPVRGITAEISL